MIQFYVEEIDDDSDEGLDWSSYRLFLPLSIIKPGDDRYFVYTYDDGTFNLVNKQNRLTKYTGPIGDELWGDFIKNIFEHSDVIRRI